MKSARELFEPGSAGILPASKLLALLLLPLSCLMVLLLLPFLLLSIYPSTEIHKEAKRIVAFSDKLNPQFWFENVDDPLPPENYLVDDPQRVEKWYWRNPFHNFTFYVIGIADQSFDRQGLCPADVFNPNGGWNWAVSKKDWLRLPFISFENDRISTYFGWRNGGNFGIKLNIHQTGPPEDPH